MIGEVYAMGLRNSSGLAFGPQGSRFWKCPGRQATRHGTTRAIACVANGAEKTLRLHEKGQDAGFPDKEGLNFVNIKPATGPDVYRGNNSTARGRNPQLYIGDKPFVFRSCRPIGSSTIRSGSGALR